MARSRSRSTVWKKLVAVSWMNLSLGVTLSLVSTSIAKVSGRSVSRAKLMISWG